MKNVEKYYGGYTRLNKCNEYLEFKNGEYKFMVDSDDHMYDTYYDFDAYNSKGEFVKTIRENKRETVNDIIEVKNQLTLIQIDYEFKLIPIGIVSTQSEVQSCVKILNNSNMGNFYHMYCVGNDFHYSKTNYNIKEELDFLFRKPIEVCLFGYSLNVVRKSYSKFINLDLDSYKKMKNNFIKNNPKYEDQANALYNYNLEVMSCFYMTSVKSLKSKRFNKLNNSVNRLNYNINLNYK